jgi:hypothetical protein
MPSRKLRGRESPLRRRPRETGEEFEFFSIAKMRSHPSRYTHTKIINPLLIMKH